MYCDLVQCYKIVYKLVDLPMEDFFPHFHSLRGHSLQLKPVGSLSIYSCRYKFFSQRFIKVWNSLSSNIIEAKSLDAVKSRLSKIDLSCFCKVYIISSREYISACTCHYLSQCTFCTCKSINQSINHGIIDCCFKPTTLGFSHGIFFGFKPELPQWQYSYSSSW